MSWWTKLTAVLGRQKLDRELDAELETHLRLATDDLIASGLPPAEARRQARVKLGGLDQARELHRDARGWPWLEEARQDVRYAARSLRRDASFTLFAVLIIGLGAGASTAVYSIVNTVLVKPLPFREPERLVWIANRSKDADNLSSRTMQVTPVQKLAERNGSIEEMAAYFAFYRADGSRLTGTAEPERVTGVPVSERFFPLLGVSPRLGRHFTPDECKFGAPTVALLSHGFWQRRFNGDAKIAGQSMRVDDQLVTIVGVMPETFDFAAVFQPGTRADFYLPFPMTAETNRWGNTLAVVGRLKPGATLGGAQAELAALAPRINGEDNRSNQINPQLTMLGEYVGGRMRTALLLLASAVFVVMLIVCANLSNLMLARTSARAREFAIRTALGAGGGRLVRQLLTETLLLTGVGALAAIAVAVALVQGVSRMTVFQLPLLSTLRVDVGVLAFAVGLSVATGLLLGLTAAWRAASLRDSSLSLRQRGAEGSGPGRQWASAGLVVAEVGFAAILLVGAGLLARSFLRVLDVDLGFRPENAISLRLEYPSPDPPQATREARAALRTAWMNDALDRVRQIPGVQGAAMADTLPFGRNRTWGAGLTGVTYTRAEYPLAFVRLVTDGYLSSMGIALKQGRDFTARDIFTSAPVMLVNESLARALVPGGGSVLGRQMANSCGQNREIIGVVEDVRHLALERGSGNEMYLPMRQCLDSMASGEIVLRSGRPVAEVSAAVDAALRPIAPDLPRGTAQPLNSLVDRAVSPRRFIVLALVAFAAFALTLASLGIYGLISYSVTRRTQEIGIRMALGESAGAVQRRIVLKTLGLALAGIFTGALAAGLLARSIGSLLYGVTPGDPWAFAGAAAVMLAVAGLAGYLPARSASRIDPMICLRAD